MDLYSYRITFILFSFLLFYSCESSNINPSVYDEENFSISGFSIHYDNQENNISIFVEISDSGNVDSIDSYITTNGDINNGEYSYDLYSNLSKQYG